MKLEFEDEEEEEEGKNGIFWFNGLNCMMVL